jgi:hypothetical protein
MSETAWNKWFIEVRFSELDINIYINSKYISLPQ